MEKKIPDQVAIIGKEILEHADRYLAHCKIPEKFRPLLHNFLAGSLAEDEAIQFICHLEVERCRFCCHVTGNFLYCIFGGNYLGLWNENEGKPAWLEMFFNFTLKDGSARSRFRQKA